MTMNEYINTANSLVSAAANGTSIGKYTTADVRNVKVIKLERLANVRFTTRTSRKNNHSLHTWSFYRLALVDSTSVGICLVL